MSRCEPIAESIGRQLAGSGDVSACSPQSSETSIVSLSETSTTEHVKNNATISALADITNKRSQYATMEERSVETTAAKKSKKDTNGKATNSIDEGPVRGREITEGRDESSANISGNISDIIKEFFEGIDPIDSTFNDIGIGDFELFSDTEDRGLRHSGHEMRRRDANGESVGIGTGSIDNIPQRDISVANTENAARQKLLETIKRNLTKDRLLHDVYDARSDSRHSFVIQKLGEIKNFNDFLLVVEHNIPNFRHFHFIHTCNYANGCRCFALKGFDFKRRTKNNIKLIADIHNEYLQNLIDYLSGEEYIIRKILFGGEEWPLPYSIKGNVNVILNLCN